METSFEDLFERIIHLPWGFRAGVIGRQVYVLNQEGDGVFLENFCKKPEKAIQVFLNGIYFNFEDEKSEFDDDFKELMQNIEVNSFDIIVEGGAGPNFHPVKLLKEAIGFEGVYVRASRAFERTYRMYFKKEWDVIRRIDDLVFNIAGDVFEKIPVIHENFQPSQSIFLTYDNVRPIRGSSDLKVISSYFNAQIHVLNNKTKLDKDWNEYVEESKGFGWESVETNNSRLIYLIKE